jgi:hypothetical protein
MTAAVSPAGWRTRTFGIAMGILWLVTYLACRLVLDRYQLATPARVAVALLPAVPFVGFLVCVIAGIRATSDELARRVHLESLAIAFPAAIVLLMVLGLLQLAVPLTSPRFNLRDIWPLMVVIYFAALAFTWRRYS